MGTVVSFDEAKAHILGSISVLGAERVGLLESLGRTIASDIVAPSDLPGFNLAMADGWAVQSRALASASPSVPVEMEVECEILPGAPAGAVPTGSGCIRVHAGSAVPDSFDAVADEGESKDAGRSVAFRRAPHPGDRMVPRGAHFREGDSIAGRGCFVRPEEINILSAFGIENVHVVARPKVSVIVSGSELAEIGKEAGPGKLWGSNLYHALARVAACGGVPAKACITGDDPESILDAIRDASGSDLLVTTGGTSEAGNEGVVQALKSAGADVIFSQTSFRPGKTFMFCRKDGIPVFCLPGSPRSITALFHLFVRPSIMQMTGRSLRHDEEVAAILEKDLVTQPGTMKFLFSKLSRTVSGFSVQPLRDMPRGGFVTSDMVNALTVVPEDVAYLKSGLEVSVIPLHEI